MHNPTQHNTTSIRLFGALRKFFTAPPVLATLFFFLFTTLLLLSQIFSAQPNISRASAGTNRTFTVSVDFSDDNTASVTIHLECMTSSIAQNDLPASEGSPAVFMLDDSTPTPWSTCTATENTVPAGYTADESGCDEVDDDYDSSCTIVNTLKTAQFTVSKDFSDDSSDSVTIHLECTSGSIDNADIAATEGFPAHFTVTGFSDGATCTATEPTVPDGYVADASGCVDVALTSTTNLLQPNSQQHASNSPRRVPGFASPALIVAANACTIVNNALPKLTVYKVVTNDNGGALAPDAWTMSVDGNSFAGSEAGTLVTLTPGNFVVSETGPTGYTATYSGDCDSSGNITLALNDAKTCTITNDDQRASLTVIKHVVNTGGGTKSAGDWTMSVMGTNVSSSSFAGDELGTTVTLDAGSYEVTESATPIGYIADFSTDCLGTLGVGESKTCIVTNTVKSQTFSVGKLYSDTNSNSVTIHLTCTSGNIDSADKPAAPSAPAEFIVSEYETGTTCTATEPNVPAGYDVDQAGCAAVALPDTANNFCTITNTLRSVTFTVDKDFVPVDVTTPVTFHLECSSGLVETNDLTAYDNLPAIFTVKGYNLNATCTATEPTLPPGHVKDEADCVSVSLLNDGVCTIFNTPTSALFTVYKDFSDDSMASVTIHLACTSGSIDNPNKTATESSPAHFTVTGSADGATCTATEPTVPTGYAADVSQCVNVALTSTTNLLQPNYKQNATNAPRRVPGLASPLLIAGNACTILNTKLETTANSDGDLNDPSIWTNGAPGTYTSVTIPPGRTITVNSATTIGALTLETGSTLIVNAPLTLNGALMLAAGSTLTINADLNLNALLTLGAPLDMGTHTLTMGCAAQFDDTSYDNFVIGSVKKEFCATGAFSYFIRTANGIALVDVNVTALGVSPSALTIKAEQGNRAGMNASQSVQRYWTLTETNDLTVDLTFHYLDEDVNGTEADYVLHKWNGATETIVSSTLDTNANTISATGISSFSDWAIGGQGAPTNATLTKFGAKGKTGKTGKQVIKVKWETGSELNVVGFKVWRKTGTTKAAKDAKTAKGESAKGWQQLNAELIVAQHPGEIVGDKYTYTDKKVKAGKTYFYKLEIVMADGTSEWSDVEEVKVK